MQRSWRRNHNPEDFLGLHRQLDDCVKELGIPVEATASVDRQASAPVAYQDATELAGQLQQLQDALDQPHLEVWPFDSGLTGPMGISRCPAPVLGRGHIFIACCPRMWNAPHY